jgi:L-cysteine:1D-myo-inositol 2-amino-2-deoxy-alpha-D-glucopyranoside ligase
MTLRIHNTLSRATEIFTPIEPGHARLYVCGITIYDYCHMGHARFMIAFDVAQRWLKALGYRVTYVRNVTDIDDKIIKRSLERGIPIRQLTEEMIAALHEDADRLFIERPTHEPRATQYVPQMLELIATLEKKGFGYRAPNGDVNYAVRKFPGYGKLSGKSIDELHAGERVAVLDGKDDPLDPVLWKSAKASEPDEVKWASEFGAGRPGWHIECSVIAGDRLGLPISVQGGGSDLVFPHHEMSAGHAAALAHQPLAHAYVHTGMIAYQGEKISKSLGNLVTVRGLLDGGADPRAIRLALLSHKYSDDWEWFDSELASAVTRLATWDAWASGADAGHADDAAEVVARVRARVADDLDTPGAVAAVDTAVAGGTAVTPELVDLVDALLGIRLA